SAPIDRTMSTFVALQTPVTSAPNALAIGTAKVPTPPAAPLTTTFRPGGIRPLSRRPCKAVNAARGTEAACSNETLSGFTTNLDAGAHTYSAKAPWQTQAFTPEACGSLIQTPNTSSRGLNRATFEPIASTSPDTSTPRRVTLGVRNPVIRRAMYGRPFMRPPSSGLTEAARTLIRTSLSPGTGLSTSAIWTTTSGGPYLV